MQIDLRTVAIEPRRQTFDHLARRFGDKPASRYQEGSYDIQAAENLHYRPTWAPEQLLYDTSITRIVMADWYALKDPRQYYYCTYTLARARQQDAAEANFVYVENRGLADAIPQATREKALAVLTPLRHAAWGANQNNAFICGYGYGAAFTQPCMYHGMDNLGVAQYLSRIGLLLGDVAALAAGKADWMDNPAWRELRRFTEDSLATRDPFELFVAQNVAMDGLLYPLIYDDIVEGRLSAEGGASVALLTRFMSDWFEESRKWIDAVLKTAAVESAANKAVLEEWLRAWEARAAEALAPVAAIGLGDADGAAALSARRDGLRARMKKLGLEI